MAKGKSSSTKKHGQSPKKAQPNPQPAMTKQKLISVAEKMGLRHMNPERRKRVMNKWDKYNKTQVAKKGDVRISTLKAPNERWKMSADENYQTRQQVDPAQRASLSADQQGMLFKQRSHQGALIWRTGSPALSQYGVGTDTSEPIAGHTPAFKSLITDGTTGSITNEHDKRDNVRETVIQRTLSDQQIGPVDAAIAARAATIQLMQSPGDEVKSAQPALKKLPQRFSVFSDIGNIAGNNPKNLDEMGDRLDAIREEDKMHLASLAIQAGHGASISPEHHTLLQQANGDPDQAMDLLVGITQGKAAAPQGFNAFNTSAHSTVGRLDQKSVRQMSSAGQRFVSPPRRARGRYVFN